MHPRSRATLTRPFALLGLVGGHLAAATFRSHEERLIHALLVGSTTLVAALLGWRLSRPSPRPSYWRIVAATCNAGVINGMLLLGPILLTVREYRLELLALALLCGLLYSLPFIPAFLLVAAQLRRLGRARPGSLVDGADRRAPWVAALGAASLAMLVLATLSADPDARYGLVRLFLEPAWIVRGGVALALLGLIAADGLAFVRLRRAAARRTELDLHSGEPLSPALDLGLGDERWDRRTAAAQPYRESDRLITVVRGSFAESQRALVKALALDGLALLVVLSWPLAPLVFAR